MIENPEVSTTERTVKSSLLLVLSLFSLGFQGTARGQSDDPILAKVDKAREAYDASEVNFRKGVLSRLNAAEERAVKAGKKPAVDQAIAERDAFESTGALPKSISVNDLQSQRNQARQDLQAAYTKAISELTKSRRKDEADALEREAATFNAKFAGNLIKAGTIWRGEKRYTKGGPGGSHPFELRVTERNGDDFKGIIFEDNMSHDIQGTVSGDKVEWKNTKIRSGQFPGQPQSGTLEGDTMKLSFARAKGAGGVPVEAQGSIKLQKKK
jgi:hypothetical protein